jgi:hypothetical protein
VPCEPSPSGYLISKDLDKYGVINFLRAPAQQLPLSRFRPSAPQTAHSSGHSIVSMPQINVSIKHAQLAARNFTHSVQVSLLKLG